MQTSSYNGESRGDRKSLLAEKDCRRRRKAMTLAKAIFDDERERRERERERVTNSTKIVAI